MSEIVAHLLHRIHCILDFVELFFYQDGTPAVRILVVQWFGLTIVLLIDLVSYVWFLLFERFNF
jgi:hypothetical protein